MNSRGTCAALLSLGLAACGIAPPAEIQPPALNLTNSPPPALTAALDEVYRLNRGLLTGLAADGTPMTIAPAADPAIIEARRFYDTLQTPFPQDVRVEYPDPFTGENAPMRKTAPLTFEDWKRVFAFPEQLADETLASYRDRVGIAIYYNRNELGLGRELGCSRFVDGHDHSGAPLMGVACFVRNYGPAFRMEQPALQAAIDGGATRNTVCITYRPTMQPGYQVQFYTYGAEGKRQEWARLDTLGQRPHPHVCMNCHGGTYDDQQHLAKNARFLPLDLNAVVFAGGDGTSPSLTRAGQEERLRVMNAMAMETPLTAAQRSLLGELYGGNIQKVGATATGDALPPAWKGGVADRDFFRGVIKPYCGTCHMAREEAATAADPDGYGVFGSPQVFDDIAVDAFVCNQFSMPNAQPTSLGFWDADRNPGVKVGTTTFPTAADAFLARRGLNRAACRGFTEVSGCNRGDDPDALCGGAVEGGAVCDRASGRCIPVSSGR